jgi:hypothetical protein
MNYLKDVVKENGIVHIIKEMKNDMEKYTCGLCHNELNLLSFCYECEKPLCYNHKIHISNLDQFLCEKCYIQNNCLMKKYCKCESCKHYFHSELENDSSVCYCGNYICSRCINFHTLCESCEIPICHKCKINCNKCDDIFCYYCIFRGDEICCDKIEKNIYKICQTCLQYIDCDKKCISFHTN